MPFVDEQNDNSTVEAVAGASPLGQGSASQAEGSTSDTSQQAASGGSSMIESGASVDQVQSQGAATNKKAPKASSGMFTNIQKYVAKNKPQAQKMAGAVTQDFGKQAADIKAAAQNKANTQSTLIGANKQAMNTAKTGAQTAVSNIMGGQTGVSDDAAAKFKAAREGEVGGYQQTSDLNLAEQQNRMGALSQLAQGANTEQGRRNLLGDTFKKQGEYNRGMSGLDNLITSGDKAARESLIGGVQGQSKQLGTDVAQMSTQAQQAKAAQDARKAGFGQEVTGMASGAQEGIVGNVDAQMAALKAGLYGEGGDLSKMQEAASGTFGEGVGYNTPEEFYESLKGGYAGWNKAGTRDYMRNWSLDNALGTGDGQSLEDAFKARKIGTTEQVQTGVDDWGEPIYATQQKDLTGIRENLDQNIVADKGFNQRIQDQMANLIKNASDYGIDTDSYTKQLQDLGQASTYGEMFDWSGQQQSQNAGDVYKYDAQKFKDLTGKIFGDIDAAKQDSFGKLMENKYKDSGVSAADFASGDFLDRSGVSTQAQQDKMAALQSLLGKESNALGTGSDVGQDTALLEKLRKDYGL